MTIEYTKTKKPTIVFILSDVRSGSTWLSYVLGSHNNCTHLGEYYRPFTMKNHIACRLCQAKGLLDCEYLKGIENIAPQNAFDFAFKCFKQDYMIDCSKQLDWLKLFTNCDNYDIKIIHLLRDPRAWYASQKRRNTELNPNKAMESWVATNNTITNTLEQLPYKHTTVFYDELCLAPHIYFKQLLNNYVGIPFQEEALKYWKKEQHGLGGNGAAFNNLTKYSNSNITTADDTYYQSKHEKIFYDSRWMDELSAQSKNLIESNNLVKNYLTLHNKDFNYFDVLYQSPLLTN